MVYQPTTRVLTVLELLQARQRLGGAELAERLEVDRRTVRRYITMLQDLGIPVEAERGRHGGYRLRPGFKLPPLMLTDDEALAVTLGLLAARRLGLASAAPAIEGALAKIERVLPAAVRDQAQAVQASLGFTAPPWEQPETAGATILTLSLAAHRQRRVRLRYRSWRDEETERSLDPYGLVAHAGRWYLTGWDHLRADLRTFRLDRVLAVEMEEATFTRPADFDAVAHVVRSLATVPYAWPVEALLDLPLAEARWRVAPTIATLEETPEGVLLRTRADNLDQAARFLVGLSCRFVVREPPELREALRRLAAEITAIADRPPDGMSQ